MIRPASAAEAPSLVAAYEWLFAPPGSLPPRWDLGSAAARLTRAIAADDSEVLVAADGGEVVGLCTVYLDIESVRFGRRAWVEDLAVAPQQRSRGHGKALLDAAKAWARDRGATHLELDSSVARADAHRFYERERPTWRSACSAGSCRPPLSAPSGRRASAAASARSGRPPRTRTLAARAWRAGA